MTLLDIVIGYIIALVVGLVVLLLPRKEPLPEGASVGFLLIVFFVWMIFILSALLR